MKKQILNLTKKISFASAGLSVNFTFAFIFGQKKIPKNVKKLRKF